MTVLPKSLVGRIKEQVEVARRLWEKDRAEGRAGVYLPGALARKFSQAAESFAWFWLFPAKQLSTDPESLLVRRHHLLGKVYNEAIKRAAGAAGIQKHVTSHALRHSFATHLLENGRVKGFAPRDLFLKWGVHGMGVTSPLDAGEWAERTEKCA